MALDFAKIGELKAEINSKQMGDIFPASKIEEGKPFIMRMLPPHPSMQGNPFFAITEWSFGEGKDYRSFLSLETFGEACPISAEVQAATASGDKELIALAKKMRKGTSYALNVLKLLEVHESGRPILKVDEKTPTLVFMIKQTLLKMLIDVATSRHYQPDITSRVLGYNIEVRRSGTGKDTEYFLTVDPNRMEMDKKYYGDSDDVADKVRDLNTFFREKCEEDPDRGVQAVRAYLYGETVADAAPAKKTSQRPELASKSYPSLPATLREVEDMGRNQLTAILENPAYAATVAAAGIRRIDDASGDELRGVLRSLVGEASPAPSALATPPAVPKAPKPAKTAPARNIADAAGDDELDALNDLD